MYGERNGPCIECNRARVAGGVRSVSMEVPMIYDIYWDKMRPVTQADVDQLVRVANVWEGMQRFMKQKHDELVAAIPTSPNIGHG